jgi:hypothetical protein
VQVYSLIVAGTLGVLTLLGVITPWMLLGLFLHWAGAAMILPA